jgi:hypothetical protein
MDMREGEGRNTFNKWTKVEILKEDGGWSLKNIHILVYDKGLWGKVIKYKCLRRISIQN